MGGGEGREGDETPLRVFRSVKVHWDKLTFLWAWSTKLLLVTSYDVICPAILVFTEINKKTVSICQVSLSITPITSYNPLLGWNVRAKYLSCARRQQDDLSQHSQPLRSISRQMHWPFGQCVNAKPNSSCFFLSQYQRHRKWCLF